MRTLQNKIFEKELAILNKKKSYLD